MREESMNVAYDPIATYRAKYKKVFNFGENVFDDGSSPNDGDIVNVIGKTKGEDEWRIEKDGKYGCLFGKELQLTTAST